MTIAQLFFTDFKQWLRVVTRREKLNPVLKGWDRNTFKPTKN